MPVLPSPAPVAAFAGYERGQVTWSAGVLKIFASSASARRGFRAQCGSTLTYEGEHWPTEIHLHVGAFDDGVWLVPTGHAFAEERLPWLHVNAEGERGV